MTGPLVRPRGIALAVIAVLVAATSLVSFAESYRGLWLWAHEHGLTGAWAVAWPLQVDTFIAVGELALFVALVDAWAFRSRLAAWAVTIAGLAVSVAGNVGHIEAGALASRVTAAVPPLAAAAALAVGLGVLKRVVASRANAPATAALVLPDAVSAPALSNGHSAPAGGREAAELYAAELAAGELPSVRRIQRERSCGRPRAQEIRAYLSALTAGERNRHNRQVTKNRPGLHR